MWLAHTTPKTHVQNTRTYTLTRTQTFMVESKKMSMNGVIQFLLTILVVCSCKQGMKDELADFSNSWAIEVRGGLEIADEIAKKHGFINKGQVGQG